METNTDIPFIEPDGTLLDISPESGIIMIKLDSPSIGAETVIAAMKANKAAREADQQN